ncbi:MAG: FhaA domain-containing protein [Actinomycetota bacterium]
MNLAQGLERRLEKFADGASASIFRGTMHPIAIATRLVRQLEYLEVDSASGPQVPNDLTVSMHASDLDPSIDRGALTRELEHAITQTATDRGWRLVGTVGVHIRTDGATPRGIIDCDGDFRPTELAPWGQLIADDGSAVLPISFNRTLIGRDLDCDVRIANQEISRHHAVMFREGDRSFLTDLKSSNGTFVNATAASAEPIAVVAGDNVLLGDLSFTYRTMT